MEEEEVMMLGRLYNTTLYAVHEYTTVKLQNLNGVETSFPKLLIILNNQHTREIASSDIELLAKMADWLGISKDAVALLGNHNLPSFRHLYSHQHIRNIILYGITPDEIGLQLELRMNKAFSFMECKMLFTASFAEVQNDKKLKNDFFNELRNSFKHLKESER